MTYLSLLESLPSTADAFLCTLFPCTHSVVGSLRNIVLAVNADGIKILNSSTLKTIDVYDITELFQWGFESVDRSFYIKLDEDSEKMHFYTDQGVEISVLLTDIAVARINDVTIDESSDDDDDDEEFEEEDAVLEKMI